MGDLDRVRIVQLLVFVASAPDFGLQSRVANAASELLIEVLGENGRHARTATSMLFGTRLRGSRTFNSRKCIPSLIIHIQNHEEYSVNRIQPSTRGSPRAHRYPLTDRAGQRDAGEHRPHARLRYR
ncbi:RidA family protein [Arthrobacter sp. D1-29]